MKKSKSESSQSLVEFSICLVILIPMLFAIIEMAWMFNNQLAISNAAREGARSAAVGNSIATIGLKITNSIQMIQTNMVTSAIVMQHSANNGTSWSAFPIDSGGYNGVPSGNLIKINVTCNNVSLTRFFNFLTNLNLQQSVCIKREPT